MTNKSPSTNRPVKVFRARGISASVFRNVVQDSGSPFYKVSVQRTYKQDGEYRSTSTFGRDELPIAMLLMMKAMDFVLESEVGSPSDDSDE